MAGYECKHGVYPECLDCQQARLRFIHSPEGKAASRRMSINLLKKRIERDQAQLAKLEAEERALTEDKG